MATRAQRFKQKGDMKVVKQLSWGFPKKVSLEVRVPQVEGKSEPKCHFHHTFTLSLTLQACERPIDLWLDVAHMDIERDDCEFCDDFVSS